MKKLIVAVLAIGMMAGCKKEKIRDIYYQVGIVMEKNSKNSYDVYYVPDMFWQGQTTKEYNGKTVKSFVAGDFELNVGDSVRMKSDPNVSGKNRSYSKIVGKWPQ